MKIAALNRLKGSGIDSKQAEAIAEFLDQTQGEQLTERDLQTVRIDLQIAIAKLENTVLRWMMGLILPIYALIIGLLIFMVPHLK